MVSGLNISSCIRTSLIAVVLLVVFVCDGHAASVRGSIPQHPTFSVCVTAAADETGYTLSKGKQHISQDATTPSGLFYGKKKVGAALKSVAFVVLTREAFSQEPTKIYKRGNFVKYFYRSIQPQAP